MHGAEGSSQVDVSVFVWQENVKVNVLAVTHPVGVYVAGPIVVPLGSSVFLAITTTPSRTK
jgi:hypothetical protein